MLDARQIQEIIPHRHPMLLVDRILELEPGVRAVGVKNVSNGDAFFVGHFPGYLDPYQTYLSHLYGDVLGRGPDTAGLQSWQSLMHQGTSSQQVAQAFWQSAEHRAIQVTNYYQTLLHRGADPAGLQHWVNLFLSGATETNVEFEILSSGEYQAAHSDNAAYVQALYLDVLGRQADSGGATAWGQLLSAGMTRIQVAQQLLTSAESYRRLVDSLYLALLHRPADKGGEQAWVTLLGRNAVSPDWVAETFLASAEYLSQPG